MGGEKRTSVELWTRGRVHVTLEGEHGGIGAGARNGNSDSLGRTTQTAREERDFALMRKDGEKRRRRRKRRGEKGEDGWRKMRFKERQLVRLL